MEERKPVFTKSDSVQDMQQVRLMALLQELERKHGRKGAAALLGLDHRTLSAALDDGVLSRRVKSALEEALQEGVGSAADRQRERNDGLEERLEALEAVVEEQGKEMRVGRRAAEDGDRAVREETNRALREMESRLARGQTGGPAHAAGAPPGGSPAPKGKGMLRREFPDLVTREQADDDEEVFGEAWPLIVEWRALKETHPSRGEGLAWLAVEERRLTLELALLEDHGMTLPPETYPLRGFDRDGQITWRRTALSDTRRARARSEILRWVRRVCTLGLWRG